MKLKTTNLALVFALLIACFLPGIQQTSAATKNMYVHFINVGQGDSIYIKTPNGDDIIIDGGNRDGNDIVAYLKKQKVNDIEVMISTHPDADHMGGLDEVLKAYKVKSVYAPKVANTTQVYKDFLSAVKREGVKIKTAQKGVALPLKGVTASFIAPVKAYSSSDLNDWSAVLKLTYGKKSFLFTGDAETKSETDMINSKQALHVDVLKVGHHGAKTSTSAAFLKVVKPTFAVISVGKNSYGHPTSDVLSRLKTYKVNVFRTDKQGSIIATTNGTNLSFNTKPSISNSAPAPVPTAYKLTASLSTSSPKQYSTVYLSTKGLPSGTSYKAVFHYKTTNTTYYGKVGTNLPVKIGRASTSFRVYVDVIASYKGKNYSSRTSFLPR
jgi:competence protein ComEC